MLPVSPASDAPTIGQVLDDRFRLLQVVQEDRAGLVFDALDEVTAEIVRVRLTLGPVDEDRLGILHPGLARPIARSADGTYVVLQDLDDEPLRVPVFPSVERMADLADEVLPTFAALHDHGIVHGELQPGSFWRDRDGAVRLVDLGLAVTLDRRAEHEPYVAPERAFGRDPDDPRIDVFALAAVLFRHATGEAPSPQALEAAELPDPVRQVFGLALDARPVFRPTDAGALHRALQEALARSTEQPALEDMPEEPDGTFDAPTFPPSARRLSRPHGPELGLVQQAMLPWWTALLLVGGLSLLLGTVVFLFAVAVGSATLL